MTKVFWIIYTGKREYKLTEAQHAFIKRESSNNGKTIFWFDDFVISLPHVTSMDKVREHVDDAPDLAQFSLGVVDLEKVGKMRSDVIKKIKSI